MPFNGLPNELVLSIAAHLLVSSLSALSRASAHLNALLARPLLNAIDKDNAKALLFWSAGHDRPDILQRSIATGIDIRSALHNSWISALHCAARHGKTSIIRILLDHGAPADGDEPNRHSPLHWAAAKGHLDVITQLLDAGANINLEHPFESTTALSFASRYGHLKATELLLARGADIDAGGLHALPMAVVHGHVDVVEYLLDRGLPINRSYGAPVTRARATALQLACAKGRTDVVKLLLERGADVGLGIDRPLARAVLRGDLGVVEMLIGKGAKIDFVDRKGRSMTTMAKETGRGDIVRLLTARPA